MTLWHEMSKCVNVKMSCHTNLWHIWHILSLWIGDWIEVKIVLSVLCVVFLSYLMYFMLLYANIFVVCYNISCYLYFIYLWKRKFLFLTRLTYFTLIYDGMQCVKNVSKCHVKMSKCHKILKCVTKSEPWRVPYKFNISAL